METLQQIQQQLPLFVIDIIRLCIWLFILALIFIPLERLCALHRQKICRKGIFLDLSYYFLNSLLPAQLLILPMASLAWYLQFIVPSELQQWAGHLPLLARLMLAMVVGEIGAYWGHRWMHQFPLLWRFHAIHHNAEEIDWLVNTHAHPFDLVFTRLCGFVPMYLFGLAQPMANAMDTVSLLVILIGTIWGFFIHANIRWRFGLLELFIATPAFHHWHHANDGPDVTNKNFAAMLPWVDKIFGTYYLPSIAWPTKYGIDKPISSSLTRQLVYPFMLK
ncbi:MAG: sterol desaturase family protein [Methylococcales bacterium]